MMNVKQPLNNKRNWVGADYKKIKKARKEIEVIYEEYIKEVGDLTEKHRKAEFEAITTMDEAKWKEASELAKKLKSVKISNYSMLDPDEFLAESFANANNAPPATPIPAPIDANVLPALLNDEDND